MIIIKIRIFGKDITNHRIKKTVFLEKGTRSHIYIRSNPHGRFFSQKLATANS